MIPGNSLASPRPDTAEPSLHTPAEATRQAKRAAERARRLVGWRRRRDAVQQAERDGLSGGDGGETPFSRLEPKNCGTSTRRGALGTPCRRHADSTWASPRPDNRTHTLKPPDTKSEPQSEHAARPTPYSHRQVSHGTRRTRCSSHFVQPS